MSNLITYRKVSFSIRFYKNENFISDFYLFDYLVPYEDRQEKQQMIHRVFGWTKELRKWFTLENGNLLNRFITFLDNLPYRAYNDIHISDLSVDTIKLFNIDTSYTYDIVLGNNTILENDLSNEEFIANFCTTLM